MGDEGKVVGKVKPEITIGDLYNPRFRTALDELCKMTNLEFDAWYSLGLISGAIDREMPKVKKIVDALRARHGAKKETENVPEDKIEEFNAEWDELKDKTIDIILTEKIKVVLPAGVGKAEFPRYLSKIVEFVKGK
jgi:hypothetical protein